MELSDKDKREIEKLAKKIKHDRKKKDRRKPVSAGKGLFRLAGSVVSLFERSKK